MILDLDFGNTRVKWRIVSSTGDCLDRNACAASDENWLEAGGQHGVDRIRVSCVAGADRRRRIKDRCFSELNVEAEFARSSSMARGIRNGYEDPERLGVDRWLAIIAGYTLSGGAPCCIVDCGSAITIDYVSKGGSHEGGVIAPGLLLMKRALLQDTSEITIQGDADQSAQLVPLGRNTETAVDSGLKFMEAGLIEIALQRYAVKFGEDAELILTGGDAETVNGLIGFESRIIPDLVLDGLALALP